MWGLRCDADKNESQRWALIRTRVKAHLREETAGGLPPAVLETVTRLLEGDEGYVCWQATSDVVKILDAEDFLTFESWAALVDHAGSAGFTRGNDNVFYESIKEDHPIHAIKKTGAAFVWDTAWRSYSRYNFRSGDGFKTYSVNITLTSSLFTQLSYGVLVTYDKEVGEQKKQRRLQRKTERSAGPKLPPMPSVELIGSLMKRMCVISDKYGAQLEATWRPGDPSDRANSLFVMGTVIRRMMAIQSALGHPWLHREEKRFQTAAVDSANAVLFFRDGLLAREEEWRDLVPWLEEALATIKVSEDQQQEVA